MRSVAVSLLLSGAALPALIAATGQRGFLSSSGAGVDLEALKTEPVALVFEANDTNATEAPTPPPAPETPAPTPAPTPEPNVTATTAAPGAGDGEGPPDSWMGLPALELNVLRFAGLLFLCACCCLVCCQDQAGGPPNEYQKALMGGTGGGGALSAARAVEMTTPPKRPLQLPQASMAPPSGQAPEEPTSPSSMVAAKTSGTHATQGTIPARRSLASMASLKSDKRGSVKSGGILGWFRGNKYSPASVPEAWQNHLDAFVAQDVEQIALDYDKDSVLQIFYDNGWTRDGGRGTLEEFVGVDAIKGFFTALFAGLDAADVNVPAFQPGGGGNPVVEGGDVNAANVFLVWQAVNSGILKATDTFMWTKNFKVRKQNIVATVAGPAPGRVERNPPAPTPTKGPIASGWQNHFEAFGGQDTPKILADYTEQSVIRVWDWTTATYSESKGLAAIEAMFNGLWVAINAGAVGGDPGIGLPDEFPRVEVGKKSVFLVWRSHTFVQATDTFLFDDKGKITVQTIVVSTKEEEEKPFNLLPSAGTWFAPRRAPVVPDATLHEPIRMHPEEEVEAPPAATEAPVPVISAAASSVNVEAVGLMEQASEEVAAMTAQASEVNQEVVGLLEQVRTYLQKMDSLRQKLAEHTLQEADLRHQVESADGTTKASLTIDVEAAAGEKDAAQAEMDTLDADFSILAGKCLAQEELAPTSAKVKELMAVVRTEEERIHEKKERLRAATASKFGPSKAGGRRGTVNSKFTNVTEGTGDDELKNILAKRKTRTMEMDAP